MGRRDTKEIKIRLNEILYNQLVEVAKRSLRSVTKQVALYVTQGLKREEGA